MPSNLTSGTVANTIPHSVMGELVVGNYDLVGVPGSGNAFLYNTTSGTYTIFSLGGWVAIGVPDATMTTGNTVIDNVALGIYMTGTAAYIATVPEPG